MYKRHTTLDQITAALTLALAESFEDNAPWRTIQAYVAKRDGKRYDKRDTTAIYALFPSLYGGPGEGMVRDGVRVYEQEMSGGYQMVVETYKNRDRHWLGSVNLIESRITRTFDLAYFCKENARMLGGCDERNAARKAVTQEQISAFALKIWRLRDALTALGCPDGDGLSRLINAGAVVDNSIEDVVIDAPGSLRTR